MKLTLVRHGKAEGTSISGRDEDRELLPVGERTIRAQGKVLARMGASFGAVLSSPYSRAMQTAQALVEEIPHCPKPVPCNELASGTTWEELQPRLEKVQTDESMESIILVGHMPDLGEILGRLLHTPYAFSMRTATICQVEIPDPSNLKRPAQLKLYLEPPL